MATDRQALYARLNRAKVLLADFNDAETAFLQRKPYSVSIRFNQRRRQYSLWFHVNERPSVELSLILSECVHHLRATLDNAVCAIAARQLGCDDRTAMPVCLRPEESGWQGTRKRLRRLNGPVIGVLKDLQPFNESDIFFARHHRLYLLDKLWNADKHRALAFTLGTSRKLHLGFSRPVDFKFGSTKGFTRDGPIFRVVPRGWEARRAGDLRYPYKLDFRVGFGDGGPYQNGLVVGTNLALLYGYVRSEALPKLLPFL